MKLLLLTRSQSFYSSRRLILSGEERGHDVICVDPPQISVDLHDRTHLGLRLDGADLDSIDIVLPRVAWSAARYTISLLRQFEVRGVPSINSSSAISRVRQKWRCLQFLSGRGFPVPRSMLIRSPKGAGDAIQRVGGLPVVVKFTQGTQGTGVMLVESVEGVESLIDAFRGIGRDLIIQEFVSEARGEDLRYFVVSGQCVAAIKRKSRDGSFRSNLHGGGSASSLASEGECAVLARKATLASGLDVSGVDILMTSRGPLILEVNASPGLEGIEAATGIDVSSHIMDLVDRKVGRG